MYINYFIEEDEEEKEVLHWHLGDLYTESGQTLEGSFSAGWLAGWFSAGFTGVLSPGTAQRGGEVAGGVGAEVVAADVQHHGALLADLGGHG